jgi:hypothetical protein
VILTPEIRAAIRAYTRRVKRARDEYAVCPNTIGYGLRYRTCVCGCKTEAIDGICRACQKEAKK